MRNCELSTYHAVISGQSNIAHTIHRRNNGLVLQAQDTYTFPDIKATITIVFTKYEKHTSM